MSKFNIALSALLFVFGLLMIYRGLVEKATAKNVDVALGIVLVIYGVSRYLLYSRMGRPRQ